MSKIGKIEFESSCGPMKLVKVVTAKHPVHAHYTGVHLHLKGGALFAVGHLHAFVGIRDGVEMLLRGGDIRKGDRFWLDVSAFTADGSIYFGKQNEEKLT